MYDGYQYDFTVVLVLDWPQNLNLTRYNNPESAKFQGGLADGEELQLLAAPGHKRPRFQKSGLTVVTISLCVSARMFISASPSYARDCWAIKIWAPGTVRPLSAQACWPTPPPLPAIFNHGARTDSA